MNYSSLFKILADDNRLKILSLLSEKNLCGCNILEHLNITQPTLSHHMEVLEEANLVTTVRQGNKTFYQLNRNTLNSISEYLNDISKRKVVEQMAKKEKKAKCSSNCECGCQEGKKCTCGDDCKCDDKCDCGCEKGKCNCGPDCKCGCNEGKKCTCK
jgi:ArsR family transcriptional regulator